MFTLELKSQASEIVETQSYEKKSKVQDSTWWNWAQKADNNSK